MYWTQFWNVKEYRVFNAENNQCLPYKEFISENAIPFFLNTIILNSNEDPNNKIGNPTEIALLKYFHL